MFEPTNDGRTVRDRLMDMTPAEMAAVRLEFDPINWAENIAHISLPKSGPLNFREHPFMRQIYRDVGGEVVIIKGAQMGMSTMSITRALWAATKFPMSIIYCVDDQTEILGKSGWLRYDQVSVGDEILTFDTDSQTTRWSSVDEMFVRDYEGPMVKMTSQSIDALVTPNHWWPAKPVHGTKYHFYETENLPNHQLIPLRADHGDDVDPIYTDDFVEMIAWVITEGHYRRYKIDSQSIVITQSIKNKTNCDRIIALAKRLGANFEPTLRKGVGRSTERIDGTNWRIILRGELARQIRKEVPDKKLTPEIVCKLSQSQLNILIETMLDGDGDHHRKAGGGVFYQKDKTTSDAFGMALVLAGRAVSFYERYHHGFFSWDVRSRTDRYTKTEKIHRETVWYTGKIWCPRDRDRTIIARRNGKVYVTGQTFPSQGDVSEFTAGRINPIISASPYLKDRIQDFNSVGMKQFARIPREEQKRRQALGLETQYSTIYFKGSLTQKDATSVDADLLIHDEEDRSNPQVIEEYQSRLFHSKYKWLVRLSTPTIPNFGIHRAYLRTNKNHWEVRCPGCGAWYEMTYPRNIEPATWEEVLLMPEGRFPRFKCHLCDKTITNEVRSNGKWIPEEPNIPVHGYRISQLSAPYISAAYILEQEGKQQHKMGFHNLILGEPFEEGSTAMTEAAIMRRQNPEIVGQVVDMSDSSDMSTTMGVDVGKVLDVVVGRMENGKPHIIWFGRLGGEADEKWDKLDDLMAAFHVGSCVVDWQPETDMVQKFVQRWPGRVWRCRYSSGKNATETTWDEEIKLVTVPREETLSRSARELLETRVLPRYDGSAAWRKFIEHHENAKKVPQFEEGHEKEGIISNYVWRATGNGEDHLFHASTYEMIARLGFKSNLILPNLQIVSFKRGNGEDEGTRRGGARGDYDLMLPAPRRISRH